MLYSDIAPAFRRVPAAFRPQGPVPPAHHFLFFPDHETQQTSQAAMKKTLPKYVFAENKIREDISNGILCDDLPGERILAKQLGISYMTARKAIDNLVDAGLLVRIPGKGTYVNRLKPKEKKSHTIAFFLDDRIKEGIASPYYSLVFNAIEKEATNRGYTLMFFSDFEHFSALQTIKKIDGAIISCFPRLENKIRSLKALLPMVVIDNSAADKSIPSVIIDNYSGVVDAVTYLCSLGHERIGFISGLQDSDVGMHRLRGYKDVLERHGLEGGGELLYEGDYSHVSGEQGARWLLQRPRPPTALVCANDAMAIGAMKASWELGLEVPDDVSVVGFDDIAVASKVRPPLTTLAAPVKEISELTVGMLISLIDGIDPDNRHVALPARLIVRGSSARAKRGEDPVR